MLVCQNVCNPKYSSLFFSVVWQFSNNVKHIDTVISEIFFIISQKMEIAQRWTGQTISGYSMARLFDDRSGQIFILEMFALCLFLLFVFA